MHYEQNHSNLTVASKEVEVNTEKLRTWLCFLNIQDR